MSYRFARLALAAALSLVLSWAGSAVGAEREVSDSEAVMLVAKPQLQHPLYGNSILRAKPIAGGVHVGFIVNKPTRVTLGEAFPDHEPSKRVDGPLYLGGPVDVNMIFAMVQREGSPGQGSVQLAPDLYVAIAGDTVDKIIEGESDHARFLFGSVIWRAGELQDEVRRGMWYVMEPETAVLLKKNISGLWEELVRRSERKATML